MGTRTLVIDENYPLAGLTTFAVGGPARYFASVATQEKAQEALSFAREQGLAVFVLGGGSNILVGDRGFPGLVILNRIQGFSKTLEGGDAVVTVGAGEDWDAFTRRCGEQGWQGVECLAGVPGTVGAAPVQNIGAYGQSADAVVEGVRALELATGKTFLFTREECSFSYRKSIFNSSAAGRFLIVEVTFRLKRGSPPSLTYHDLKAYFPEPAQVTLPQVREAVLAIREKKGLLVLDGYERLKSAGSFFKNPLISADRFRSVEKAVQQAGGCSNWAWPQPSGEVKVSAACLIQSAGFVRGFRAGAVGISPRHTLAIVNYGGATAEEIVAFARQVRDEVKRRFGVSLTPEVQFIGFAPDLS